MKAMRFPADPDANLYRAGIAVGFADIKNDEITFRFKDELFTLPTMRCITKTKWNGYFYEIKIDNLRKLTKEKH